MDAMEPIRLQKYLTDCCVMSRRAAEREIIAGAVLVNGVKATLGQKIIPGEEIVTYRGKPVVPRSTEDGMPPRHTYILLNKPVGFVTTMSDPGGRKTVADLLASVGHRVYPVGRLDLYSDGLLLCTDDGDVTNRLMHPSGEVEKVYLAFINGRLSEEELSALRTPFVLDGYMLRPFGVDFVRFDVAGENPVTVVRFTLHEGRNREIRKICAKHGLKIARLTRISIGKLTLNGIPPGKWRPLTEEEEAYLKSL